MRFDDAELALTMEGSEFPEGAGSCYDIPYRRGIFSLTPERFMELMLDTLEVNATIKGWWIPQEKRWFVWTTGEPYHIVGAGHLAEMLGVDFTCEHETDYESVFSQGWVRMISGRQLWLEGLFSLSLTSVQEGLKPLARERPDTWVYAELDYHDPVFHDDAETEDQLEFRDKFGDTMSLSKFMQIQAPGQAEAPEFVFPTTFKSLRAGLALPGEARETAFPTWGLAYNPKKPIKDVLGQELFFPEPAKGAGGRPQKRVTWCLVQKRKDDFEMYFELGQSGMYWYDNTPLRILELFGGDRDRAALFMTLLAATSPLQNIKTNVKKAHYALRLYDQVGINQTKFEKAFKFEAHQKNVLRALRGEPLSGPKVTAFLQNLFGPEVYPDAERAVTVDRWMYRAALGICREQIDRRQENLIETGPSSPDIRCIARLVQQLADARYVEPRQYQAAVWVGIKSECGSPEDTADPFETELEKILTTGQSEFAWPVGGLGVELPPLEDDHIPFNNPGDDDITDDLTLRENRFLSSRELDPGDGQWEIQNPMALFGAWQRA